MLQGSFSSDISMNWFRSRLLFIFDFVRRSYDVLVIFLFLTICFIKVSSFSFFSQAWLISSLNFYFVLPWFERISSRCDYISFSLDMLIKVRRFSATFKGSFLIVGVWNSLSANFHSLDDFVSNFSMNNFVSSSTTNLNYSVILFLSW